MAAHYILLELERAGYAKVLAMVADSSNTYSATAKAAVNKTCCRANIRSALIRAASRQEARCSPRRRPRPAPNKPQALTVEAGDPSPPLDGPEPRCCHLFAISSAARPTGRRKSGRTGSPAATPSVCCWAAAPLRKPAWNDKTRRTPGPFRRPARRSGRGLHRRPRAPARRPALRRQSER